MYCLDNLSKANHNRVLNRGLVAYHRTVVAVSSWGRSEKNKCIALHLSQDKEESDDY